jgi:hypothetical protein
MSETTINPSEWVMDWGSDGCWPFVEDENANITGLGWQDPEEFAAAINRYDEHCNGEAIPEDDQWTAAYISHRWAVQGSDGERLYTNINGQPVDALTPGAIQITTLWGQR